MAFTWDFAYLLPHCGFHEPIESDFLALVPPDDSRLRSLRRTLPAVQRLVTSFTDQFGTRIRPSALLIRSDAPEGIRHFYAVASFRNVIAVSATVDGWMFEAAGGTAGYPLWSDHFDFYPVIASADGRDLLTRSVALAAFNLPVGFRGQTAPHLPRSNTLSFGIDRPIFGACLRQWNRRYLVGKNGEIEFSFAPWNWPVRPAGCLRSGRAARRSTISAPPSLSGSVRSRF